MNSNKRIWIIIGAGLLLMLSGFIMTLYGKTSTESLSQPSYTEKMFAMDTQCSITLYDSQNFVPIRERISNLDKTISAYDDDGEIKKLNENRSAVISEDAKNLIEESVSLYDKYSEVNPAIGKITKLWNVTGENPKVPDKEQIKKALKTVNTENIVIKSDECTLKAGTYLDFGATGKGFALDEVKKTLSKEDIKCAIVSFGSATLLYGTKPDGSAFNVAVTDPEDDSRQILKFSTSSCFVATSGGYERYFEEDGKKYSHIFDEKTGRPANTDLTSVTVICSSGIKADFLSTRIYIGGKKELSQWLNNDGIQVIAVDKDKNVYCSDSLRSGIKMIDENYKLN